MNKQLKYINKYYKKKLLNYANAFYMNKNSIESFIAYLMYLMSVAILTTDVKEYSTNHSIITLYYAITEYNNYINCTNSLYTFINNKNYAPSTENTVIIEEYQMEQAKHINNFLCAMRDNILNWISAYGGKV